MEKVEEPAKKHLHKVSDILSFGLNSKFDDG